jgi:hypothetical protein
MMSRHLDVEQPEWPNPRVRMCLLDVEGSPRRLAKAESSGVE